MGIHQTTIGLESIVKVNWKDLDILDVGCGNGKLMIEVAKRTHCRNIVGIDYDGDKIFKAKKLLRDDKGKQRKARG